MTTFGIRILSSDERHELWERLYNLNKDVDISTYNARKYEAQMRVRANERSDATADVFHRIGNATDNYAWNRLGETYEVEFSDSEMAKEIAFWYENNTYDEIQVKKQGREYDERMRQQHEELMRTSPEYRLEFEKKEREEREQRRREEARREAKRQKILESRLAKNAIAMNVWTVFAILLGGLICGSLFLYAARSDDGMGWNVGFGVVGAIVCLKYAIGHKSGCVKGCAFVVGGYFAYAFLLAFSCLLPEMLRDNSADVLSDGVAKVIPLAIGSIIGALHGALLVKAMKRKRVEKITKEVQSINSSNL